MFLHAFICFHRMDPVYMELVCLGPKKTIKAVYIPFAIPFFKPILKNKPKYIKIKKHI